MSALGRTTPNRAITLIPARPDSLTDGAAVTPTSPEAVHGNRVHEEIPTTERHRT